MKYALTLFSLILVILVSACADYDNGREAFRAEDYQEAKKNLEPLAFTYDHAPSKVLLADLYIRTEPAETHGAKVKQLLEEAAPVEKGKAYFIQGQTYENGYGVGVDGARAVELYNKGVDIGYWLGKYNIARMYDKGNVIPQDYDRAEMLYNDVIQNHNYARAEETLFEMKARQAIETNDIKIAGPYLEKMIADGDEKAAVTLATMYRDTVTDGSADAKILTLYQQAAELRGDGRYWFELGRIYEDGSLKNVQPNGPKALGYYQQAANEGYWRANYYSGRIYDRGKLVGQNRQKALVFYNKALAVEPYQTAQNAKNKLLDKIEKEKSQSKSSVGSNSNNQGKIK